MWFQFLMMILAVMAGRAVWDLAVWLLRRDRKGN